MGVQYVLVVAVDKRASRVWANIIRMPFHIAHDYYALRYCALWRKDLPLQLHR
jgi:hypothetical protein